MSLSVVLADDAALLRAGIARLLIDEGVRVLGEASEAEGVYELVRVYRPDVAIIDIRMPPTNTSEGLEAAARIKNDFPETGVLLLSQYVETEHALDLLRDTSGGIGYLLKERVGNVAEFVDAITRVAAGESVIDPEVVQRVLNRARRGHRPIDELTERERAVLALMAEGHSNRSIGQTLFLGERTVEAHINSIFRRLGVGGEPDIHGRVFAVLAYLRTD